LDGCFTTTFDFESSAQSVCADKNTNQVPLLKVPKGFKNLQKNPIFAFILSKTHNFYAIYALFMRNVGNL
jgi:hypothetical protein